MTETADIWPRGAPTDRRARVTYASAASSRPEGGARRPARERRRRAVVDRAKHTDNELIVRMQAGDVTAFAALYDRYCERALRVAWMVSGDRTRAEEAVQEAFGAIWSSRATYRPQRPSAAGWILTVVRNRAIDGARREATVHCHSTDHGAIDTYPAAHDVAAEAVDRVAACELKVLVGRLPDAQREVIVLAFYGQLSHTEIAAALDVPLGTVKARMRRGLHALRDELLGAAAGPG